MGQGALAEKARAGARASSVLRMIVLVLTILGLASTTLMSPTLFLRSSSFGSTLFPPFNSPFPSRPDRGTLRWKACQGYEDDHRFDCTTIEAPKDYLNASSTDTVRIALARLKAQVKDRSKYKGSIYINPGGPGGSGKSFAYRFGPIMGTLLDGTYDIIGFDPRGIGETRPLVDCFGSALDLALFKSGTLLDRPFDVAPDVFSKENEELQRHQWAEVQALRKIEMERCTLEMGADELRFMGTTSVVRDIDFISRKIDGENGLINFIGASYGTLIGSYLANMLPPERLGRIAIDGVVCPKDWTTLPAEYWLKEWMVDSDRAFEWFLESCQRAGPKECSLMQSTNDTAANIDARLDKLMTELYHAPVPVADAARPGLLTSGVIRTMMYDLAYTPQRWTLYADLFAEVLAGNYTRTMDFWYPPFPKDRSDIDQEELSRAAVTCADVVPYEDPEAGNWPLPDAGLLTKLTMQTFNETTRRFAVSSAAREPDGGCEFHAALGRAPERFAGPWNNSLINSPMLVVSNTADPATPRKCGLQVLELMGTNSARMVIQNSPGHCSFRSAATCTSRAYRDYFLHGTVPPPEGQYCDVDDDYFNTAFPGRPIASTMDQQMGGIGGEDALLGETARALSAAWAEWDDERHRRGHRRW
ncbi:hypothetical protein A4X13_0g4178 [Tilletia indica]|uniref:AB hydrolase-1 domain-containing protein n=1 Tax=Tilletia indica TaxID=43049 RepID=A0A8T8SYE5_9BASI|nr:hypothetical protein A4X13_0g4178 [Tilletia indica]